MANNFIEFDIKGIKELNKSLTDKSKKLADGRKLHARMGVQLVKWIDKNFRDEGTEKKWKPLATSTVYARRKSSSRILQDTGDLRRSFNAKSTNSETRVGTAKKHSEVHEKGGSGSYYIRPKNKSMLAFAHPMGRRTKNGKLNILFAKGVLHPALPQRKMLPTLEAGTKVCRDVYDKFIKESIK